MIIDINCDMGESYGTYKIGNDEAIFPYITSANIACGYHAGDPATMRKTVKFALEHNVGIGAHPGLPDLIGFGRREMSISPKESYDLVVYQIGALNAFVRSEGGKMQHVKAHGALYNMATKDQALSEAIAEAVYKVNPELILYGLAGGKLVEAGRKIGLVTANEVFSDRTYQEDGTLTPRNKQNSMIKDANQAIAQVVRMVQDGKVTSLEGVDLSIQADTVCIHGDGDHALSFAEQIYHTLLEERITVEKVSSFLVK